MHSILKYAIALAVILTLFVSCTPKNKALMGYDPYDTQELADMMTGTFSSSAQAGADTSYYNITLHMYPIWPDEAADYLYVEQAVATQPSRPYRQRVYKLEKTAEGAYKSSVYKIAHDSLFIGKWKTLSFFNSYSPIDLIEREGCAVILYKNTDGTYTGSTKDQACESSMRGATYATSLVDVRAEQISSWDQGFDAEGKQVWGAENGPYIFLRKKKPALMGTKRLEKETR